MKMMPAKSFCSLCIRTDVKLYHLEDSPRAPNHLRFEGHTNLQAVLENILIMELRGSPLSNGYTVVIERFSCTRFVNKEHLKDKKGKYRKATNEICRKCRDKLHGIYSFTHQYTESEKKFHQIKDVTVRLKKLKTFLILTDFKTELEVEASTEIVEDMDSPQCNSTVCDNSAVSGVVVKMECDNKFEDCIDFNKVSNDLNIGLLGEKYSNTADSKSFDQTKINSMDSEDTEQIAIEDEVIKEEWRMEEGSIFVATPNHDVLGSEQTKFRYDMYDKLSDADEEFECDQCDKKFKTSRELRDHKMAHTGVTFTCNQCDASFSSKKNLTQHLRRVHTDTVFSCDHCEATYKSKQALNRHKQIIAGLLLNCDQCEAKYKSITTLRDHKMSHTGVTFTCNQCNASFSNKRCLTQHQRRVHTDTVFSCDHCEATYKSKQALNRHKQIIAGLLLNCDQCEAKYKSFTSLRDHKMSHTGVNFTCNQCNASFSNKSCLTRHLRKVHTDRVFSCDHCDATFTSKQSLNDHKQVINGIIFDCDQCDAKFKTSEGLRDHKMTHTGVTFACNKCNASFSNKENLTQHLREVHTDAVFPCDHCEATSKTKRALNAHKHTHNGILFNCDQYEAKYKSISSLRNHKMSHTDVHL